MRKYGYYSSLILFTLLFVLPLIFVLSKADLTDIKKVFTSDYYRYILLFSIKQAFFSSVLSIIIGLPGAWILSHYQFKLKKIIKLIFFIPFVIPSIITVLGFVAAYGKNGLLNRIFGSDLKIIYTFPSVLMAHVFYNFPVVISIVSNKWETLDSDIEAEARLSGANEFIVFYRITLPRLVSSIVASGLLVYLFCFTSFAIILVLGGGPKLTTLEVEIYRQARISMNLSMAGSLALISLFSAVVIMLLYSITDKYKEKEALNLRTLSLKSSACGIKIFSVIYLFISILFITFPILSILIKSYIPADKLYLFIKPVLNTVAIGLASSVISVIMAIFICSFYFKSKTEISGLFFMIPMASSSVIVGLGYFILSKISSYISNYILIILCHSVLNVSYAIKTIQPVYKCLPDDLSDNGKIDGLSDTGLLLFVEIPYLRNSILTSLSFCFALSCGELNSTLMIAHGSFSTITLQIQRLIASYNFEGACFSGILLIVICSLFFLICEKLKAQ